MTSTRNIIIEDGFDFWKELNDTDDEKENEEIELCELTREPLKENYITFHII